MADDIVTKTKTYTDKVRTAMYGKEVRSSIADSIDKIAENVKDEIARDTVLNSLKGELAENLPFVTVNEITDCNYVTDQHNNVLHDIFNAGSPTPLNVPDNFKIGTAPWHLLTFYFGGAWLQYLTDYTTVIYSRAWSSGSWQNWDKHDIGINMTTFNSINGVSVNNILENGIYPFNVGITPLDLPFDDWKDGSVWCIINFKFSNNPDIIQQVLISFNNPFGKRQGFRQTNSDKTWQEWNICSPSTSDKIFTCDPNKTLRSVCEEAIKYKNSTVIVKSGTYDLTEEFNDHISAKSGSGIKLTNGIKIIFEAGAYVKAEIETATEYSQHNFEPFYSAGDFELIGLNISAKNTRYCVHDESGGQGTQHHIYRNCQMKYRNDAEVPHYSQCIGGGMGEHTFIEIHGGIYDTAITNPSGSQSQTELDIPISYHNGANSKCDGKIFIDGVYLKNKGHFRFGYHGSSEIKTLIEISNCSVGQRTLLTQESGQTYPENFELIEFNVVLRN